MAKQEEEKQATKIGNAPELDFVFPDFDYTSQWNTPEAFARHVTAMDPKKAWHNTPWTEKGSFYGVSMDDALNLANNGWKEGAEQVHRMRNRVLAASPILVKPKKFGLVGAVPIVARAVAGNPLNMLELGSTKSRRRPVITLISDMGVNCNVEANSITNRAAVVAAIIDHIEAAGYACEVISTANTTGWEGGKFYSGVGMTVKESVHPVDTKRLAFSLGHASMFRRLIFADWSYNNVNKKPLGQHLGSCFQSKVGSEANAQNVYLLPSVINCSAKFANEKIAETEGLEHIINELKRQGCPAFPGLPTQEKEEDETDF